MTEPGSGWHQDADGLWRYGSDSRPFSAPPQRDASGAWTQPIPANVPPASLPGSPPPESRRKRPFVPVIVAGVGGVIVGALIGAAGSDAELTELRATNTKLQSELDAARRPVATTPPAVSPSPTPTPTAVVTTRPPAPPKPVTYAQFSGSTDQRTRAFTVPDGVEWQICYNMRGSGNNAIFLEEPPGQPSDLLVNEIGPVRACTQQYAGGRFSLDVSGSGPWTITVRQVL